jgi:hypothetical protein
LLKIIIRLDARNYFASKKIIFYIHSSCNFNWILSGIGEYMAHLYPFGATSFPTTTEKSVYNALSKLGNNYYVFYDNRWSWRGRDIQTDFIIAKVDGCIQVIEVKGGVWSRDHGQLLVGGLPPSSDPVNQVIKQKKALIEKLKSDGAVMGYLPITHAIAFPETPGEAFEGCVDLPPILDSRSINFIQEWVATQMEISAKEFRQTVCDIQMIEHLKNTLSRDWTPSLQDYLNTQDTQLAKQTQQIFAAYDGLLHNQRVGIKGCAGSGKTWLMIRLANKFAQDTSIDHILVTCKNIALGEWLKKQLISNKNKIDVFPLVERMKTEVTAAGLHDCLVDEMDKVERLEFYKTVLPELYYTQLVDSREIKYDVILVDEAQMFSEDYWPCVESLLKDPESSKLHTFFDDYQRIYNESNLETILHDQLALPLSVNLRNTRSIHNQSVKFVDEEIKINQSSVTGAPVYYQIFEENQSGNNALENLNILLDDLIINNTVTWENITILTTRRKSDCFLCDYVDQDVALGSYKFTSEIGSGEKITCASVQGFRGLESQIIILGDIDGRGYKHLNYLAASRAKLMLFLLASDRFIEKHPDLTDECDEYTGGLDLKTIL